MWSDRPNACRFCPGTPFYRNQKTCEIHYLCNYEIQFSLNHCESKWFFLMFSAVNLKFHLENHELQQTQHHIFFLFYGFSKNCLLKDYFSLNIVMANQYFYHILQKHLKVHFTNTSNLFNALPATILSMYSYLGNLKI